MTFSNQSPDVQNVGSNDIVYSSDFCSSKLSRQREDLQDQVLIL